MTDFDHFDPEAVAFLRDLRANNTRDWFAAHQKTYETHVREPAKAFVDALAAALEPLTGMPHDGKGYRIHRDVRFSRDKTPYKVNIHASFAPRGLTTPPMWFFGLSPDRVTLGCGVFQYEKQALDQFRQAMAGPEGAALIALETGLKAQGMRISEPALRRVPAGYDKDHPQAAALRRKGFSVWKDFDGPAFATQPGLIPRNITEYKAFLPVFELLKSLSR